MIRCERKAHGRYEVRVAEAIGAVAAGNLQLLVEPKIPLSHLTYILQEGGQLPRIADGRAELQSDENFLNLIAFWFVQAAEELLRHDLIRDYSTINADRAAARGRIDPIPTARSLLRGRPSLRCTFDELTVDNPSTEYFRQRQELSSLIRHSQRRSGSSPTDRASSSGLGPCSTTICGLNRMLAAGTTATHMCLGSHCLQV